LIEFLKSRAVTIGLIVLNVLVFALIYLEVGTFDQAQFTSYEFQVGALFNPLTLDGEWYRLISHMFLHGMLLHLLLNMYGLFSVGSSLEPTLGSLKFLLLYLVCGFAGALASLYVSVLTISVGASGAIFGIFGFSSLVMNVIDTLESGKSIVGIILNFLVFTILYVFIAANWNVDHAGHLGGMIAGISIAVLDYYALRRYDSLTFTLVYVPVLLVFFLILPKDQVHYYRFFEKVRHAEDDSNMLFGRKGLSDNDFTLSVRRNREVWDSAAMALDSLSYVREELRPDTMKLSRYISLRSLVAEYRLRILANETYILMDSIERAEDSIQSYMQLAYVPPPRLHKAIASNPLPENVEQPELVQVWYDSNWVETSYRSVYYRLGTRDSTGQWDGPVRDHYADGKIQMKGVYNNDQRDGIFLYYSHHNTYTSAGRYFENRRVGKWQTFHNNGTLASEITYDQGSFLVNVWDSTGVRQVQNGNGTIKEYYASGTLKEEGLILNGKRNGTWTGWYPDGEMHYREDYNNGFVARGRSRNPQGDTFFYDQSTYFPLPEGGYNELKRVLDAKAQALDRPHIGTVHVYFRVTFDGLLTDFEFEKDVSPEVKNIVKALLLEGPDWRPAREFGYKPVDGYGDVKVEF
jgi:membrane associated rhomboid family serine protease/antitoxin component YwqK of YwqJK toxin-antitoxin module